MGTTLDIVTLLAVAAFFVFDAYCVRRSRKELEKLHQRIDAIKAHLVLDEKEA